MPIPSPTALHSSPEAAALFSRYHTVKSSHNIPEWLNFFAESTFCGDSTLGWTYPNRRALQLRLESITPVAPTGVSYCTRVLGKASSAVIAVTDSPERFGDEIRTLSAVDTQDGRIVRFIDYWDGRNFGSARTEEWRVQAEDFPDAFGEHDVPSRSDPAITDIAAALNHAFNNNDVAAATSLFAEETVFEDMTLHAVMRGRGAVSRYLSRTDGRLPYAQNVHIVHTLGNHQGGGYEWRSPGNPVRTGIVGIELDAQHLITRFTAMWDGSCLDDPTFSEMTQWAMEPKR